MLAPRICAGALALLVGAACVPPEDDDSIKRYPADTALGAIQRDGELVVAVPSDRPPFSFVEEDEPDGFAIELVDFVASNLGVEPRYVAVPAEEVLAELDSGEVDMAVPLRPITEEQLRLYSYSSAIYIGAQRLLVPSASAIDSVEDLAGRTVCEVIDDDTGIALSERDAIEGTATAFPEDCLPPLKAGTVDAVTGPDLVLQWLKTTEPGLRIAGEDINTVGYGIAMPLTSIGAPAFVNKVLAEAEEEGLWTEAYDDWIAPLSDEPTPEPPDLSAGEAAAFYPIGV